MKKSENTVKKAAPLITAIFLLVLWEVAVRLYAVEAWILPGPIQVARALINSANLLLSHSMTTIMEAILGFTFSIILAMIVAFLLTSIDWLKQAFYPLLIVSQTIPLITLAVLFTIWFGWGLFPKVLIVVLVCFFPITINLINGLNSVDIDQVGLFHSMGASSWDTFKMVKFPHALPAFFTGLKISATYSVMAAVVGEWLGAKKGLGYFMTITQKSFAIDKVIAAVVVICIISLGLVKLIEILEQLLIPWNRMESK